MGVCGPQSIRIQFYRNRPLPLPHQPSDQLFVFSGNSVVMAQNALLILLIHYHWGFHSDLISV